ncbi:MAG: hypothetical protein ABR503_12465 [Chitinophagaceae bacterium]
MLRKVQLNINLTPIVEYDSTANRFIIYYEEFPEAIATGINEDEAQNNLAFLVEDMWVKRTDELKEYLLRNHKHQIQIQTKSVDQKGIL